MSEKYVISKKITNIDVNNMIEGICENYILREGLCGADLTECDMSELDFEHFKLLCFDENTKFSEEQLKKFKPFELLIKAKSPMKDIQSLHLNGINGEGVIVAIIESDIFYRDFTYCFRDIKSDWSENFQESLCEPEDLQHQNLWNEIINGYNQMLLKYGVINIEELKTRLKELGSIDELIRIIEFEPILQYTEFSSGKNSPLHFLKQRDKVNEKSRRNNNVEVPCGGRTLNGKYWGTSSASYTIPVIAGIFAMCRQINPEIEYEEFVRICKDTARIVNGCNLIQPKILMEKVRVLLYAQRSVFSVKDFEESVLEK